jgi:hypothetical protein
MLDGLAVVALLGHLSAVEARARSRVARLLVIGEMEARAVLLMAGGARLTVADLEARLDLSRGAAQAFAQLLGREALIVREPDPRGPGGVRFRLSDGAQNEVSAALGPWIDRLDAVTARLTDAERRVIASYLDEIATK